MRVSFWAQLSRDDGTTHGCTRTSPAFGTQSELAGWVRVHRQDGDDLAAWKRESTDGDHRDIRLASADPPADQERLAALIAPARAHLTSESRHRTTDRERGERSRARLEAAGRGEAPEPPPGWSRLNGGTDALEPMLTHADAYPPEPEPYEEPEPYSGDVEYSEPEPYTEPAQ